MRYLNFEHSDYTNYDVDRQLRHQTKEWKLTILSVSFAILWDYDFEEVGRMEDNEHGTREG